MATNVTPEELGAIFATFAPDVPVEVAGAMLKQESNFSTDPKSYEPNMSGNQGPGQIGVPEFNTFFPSKQLGRAGNPNDMKDSAIAAARMVQDRWVKSEGDLNQVARGYYGKGTAKDGSNATDYMHAMLAEMATLQETPLFTKFATGNAFTRERNGIKSTNKFDMSVGGLPIADYLADKTVVKGTARNAELRLGRRTVDELAAAPQSQSQTLFKPGEVKAILDSTQFDLDNVISAVRKSANAELQVADAKTAASEELAAGAKQAAQLFGFDMGNAASVVEVVANKMKANVLAMVVGQEDLHRKQTTNPVYSLLDNISGGMLSAPTTERLTKIAAENTQLSKAMTEMEGRAKATMEIGKATISQITNAEAQAAKGAIIAKNEVEIAKLLQTGNKNLNALSVKLDSMEQTDKIKQASAALAAEKNAWQKAVAEQKAATGANVGAATVAQKEAATLIARQKLAKAEADAAAIVDADNNINKWAGKLGITRPELDKLSKQDKVISRLVVGDSAAPAAASMHYLAMNGMLRGDAKVNYDAAFGAVGYARGAVVSRAEFATAKTPEARQALVDAKTQLFNSQQLDIYVTGAEPESKRNPYGAVYGAIKAIKPNTQTAQAAPETVMFQSTPLAKTLDTKYGKNSSDRQQIGDADIIKTAQELVATQGLANVASQVALYYTGAVKLNNFTKKFGEVGLAEQTGYYVNTRSSSFFTMARFGELVTSTGRSLLRGEEPQVLPPPASATLAKKSTSGQGDVRFDLTDVSNVQRLLLAEHLASKQAAQPEGAY